MWTEEMIREEMRKLDEKTGLHGSELPIRFGKAKTSLACLVARDGKPDYFRFSRYYFDSPDFARGSAVETICHEYAHYMDVCRRGTSDHGKHWKACCEEIYDELNRCFNPLLNVFRLSIERDEPLDKWLNAEIPFTDFSDDKKGKEKLAA